MKKLNARMTAFFGDLYEGDKKVFVYGEGDAHARLMLIGEAPGEREALEGRPFVGKAGKNLDEFLRMTGLSREEMYITNTVKFRPVAVSKAGRTVNRTPTTEEVTLFLPWLREEIALVNPRWIVTLGNTALRAVCGKGVVIGEAHGRFRDADGKSVYPLYHPASVIYNPALKAVYAEDVLRLASYVRDQA